MKFPQLSLPAVLCLALGFAGIAQATPITNVVYGNLGSSGTNGVGVFNADINGSGQPQMAQGFSPSSPKLSVQSVSLWLFGGFSTASVAIFDDTGGEGYPGDPIAVSSSQTIGEKALYQFTFSGGVDLVPGAYYWIVPQGEVSWYLAGYGPSQQNFSGYAFTQAAERPYGGFWQAAGTNLMSVSMNAVPEPTTCALGAIGIAAAGLARWRRRLGRTAG